MVPALCSGLVSCYSAPEYEKGGPLGCLHALLAGDLHIAELVDVSRMPAMHMPKEVLEMSRQALIFLITLN